MAVFNRVKSTTVLEQNKDTLLVQGLFIDSFHEINFELQVDRKAMCVLSARADMVRIPHPDCREALQQLAALEGIKIGHGARKAIASAVGNTAGCTHLADLALDAFKAVIQANFQLQKRELTADEQLAKLSEQLGGTCYYWSKGTIPKKS